MVVVVGELPEEIRVSREEYVGLLRQLDAAAHSSHPSEAALAHDLLATVRFWFQQVKLTGQVDGQLELPLEWDAERAAR